MLVHRKNMIGVTVGWTNQFIMNNLKIQMSEGDVLGTDGIQQNQRRPRQGGRSALSWDATTSFPPKKASGRAYQDPAHKLQTGDLWSRLPPHTKPSDLRWSCGDLYLCGLSAGRGELPGFPQSQPLLSVSLSSSQPLPGICHLWVGWGFFFLVLSSSLLLVLL